MNHAHPSPSMRFCNVALLGFVLAASLGLAVVVYGPAAGAVRAGPSIAEDAEATLRMRLEILPAIGILRVHDDGIEELRVELQLAPGIGRLGSALGALVCAAETAWPVSDGRRPGHPARRLHRAGL